MLLVSHAQRRRRERNIPDAAIAAVIDDPELQWPSRSGEGRPVTVMQRGAIRVIVGDDDQTVVTAMWVHSRTGGCDPSARDAERLVREVMR